MPAIITHYFFAKDSYEDLKDIVGTSRECKDAFILGNQGPDPIFYAALLPSIKDQASFGSILHHQNSNELFVALKQSLEVVDKEDLPIAQAYALGFLHHYLLDSTAHPFVYAQQYALCDAGVQGLTREDGAEVHATIETELDEMMLYTTLKETISTFHPGTIALTADDRVLDVISKMYLYISLIAFRRVIPKQLFGKSVKMFRVAHTLLLSPHGVKRTVVGLVEEKFRHFSLFKALCIRNIKLESTPYDNREHNPWVNPSNDEIHTESFFDLYQQALARSKSATELFLSDKFSKKNVNKLTLGVDFEGKPLNSTDH